MLRSVCILLAAMISSLAYAQRFGTVDLAAIKADMPEMQEVQAVFEASSKKYEVEFNNLREKFQKEFNEYQTLAADTPKSIKERRAQEIQELDNKMQQFINDSQAELQQLQESLINPIEERIRMAIATVAREEGFSLILDVTQPLYIEAEDVTPQVRTMLGI